MILARPPLAPLAQRAALLVLLISAPALPAFAQAPPAVAPAPAAGPNDDRAAPQQAEGPLARLHLAGELYALARRNADPLLALAAARLALPVTVREGTRRGEVSGGRPVEKPEPQGPEGAAAMLETARQLAAGHPDLLALLAETTGGQARGRTSGPVAVRIRLDPGATWTAMAQEMVFRAGERAEIRIEGDGDTDVDLFVLDEIGTPICARTGPSDREFCAWTPRWTGAFLVRMVNLGNVPNFVRFYTN